MPDTRRLPACAAAILLGTALAVPAAPYGAPTDPDPALVVPVQDRRVTETLDLPTWRLQQVRRRMLRGQRISFDDMRALADLGDGLASWRYANRLMALEDPDLHSAAALYYATAAYTGRDYAVRPLVRLLERRDVNINEARLRHLENALRSWALRGNEVAQEALISFYASGHPFGRHPERAREFRRELALAGDLEAAMALVIEAMSSGEVETRRAELIELLDVVIESEELGMRTTAINLRTMLEAVPDRLADAAETAPVEETEE
ncbi:hypothetical protein [Jannaschia formosa]|uniref:hypothetical protein n=1 Tax=Jannaschia formosa TaxID=2259592 RepID=UPI001075606C|nr:hypothetical protein [Jannaschia formosa]TFL16188.1 hypothetical protein DR046_21305 [Jannaschia formosa]